MQSCLQGFGRTYAERLRALRANITEQRAVKQQARHQRQRRGLSLSPFDPDLLPIHVADEGPYVHHAASEEDIRAVLRRLPRGMLDGLTSIHLCLNRKEEQNAGDEQEVDPYLETTATELLPGVYQGETRGECSFGGGRIAVFAHIHASGAAGIHAIYLKLRALATLVHECAHHFDDTFRADGDRWHKRDYDRNEAYVRARALDLVRACVVPFLEERYPSECQALREWMERYGGVALPLALLTDDREMPWADYAYCRLAQATANGTDSIEARRDFAEPLSFGGHHREAVLVLERALAERSDDVETMLYLADAYRRAGHVDEAETLCMRMAELKPQDQSVWMALARVHRRCARWEKQAMCADRALVLQERHEGERAAALQLRADAWIGLGRWDDLSADIAALKAIGSSAAEAQAGVLTLRMQCHTGRWEEALAGAIHMLRRRTASFMTAPYVKAVRFECAHRLGRRRAAGTLADRDVEMLRSNGQGAWVDRLVADFDLRAAEKSRSGDA